MVVSEAPADFRAARILVDRVLYEIEWLRDQELTHFRCWVGLDDSQEFVQWAGLREEIERRGLRVPRIFGRFDGEPGAPDARAARFALLAFADLPVLPDAIVLLRDADNQPTRRDGLTQARNALGAAPAFAVVIGVADPKREAWILAAFRAQTDDERASLARLTQELGFDPTLEPQRLRGKDDARDSKRVLAALSNGIIEREDDCLRHAHIADAAPVGASASPQSPPVGLREFINDLRSRLVPVVSDARAPFHA